jgi:CubicO group peptidase (beta-lactamase class C family)
VNKIIYGLSISWCFVLAVQTSAAVAESSDIESNTLQGKVSALFAAYDKPGSPGAAVLVIREGDVIYQDGFGRANLEYDVPITSDSIFHVASVSKQFTAFAIALLDDQGKLSVDDDVRKYIPELPDYGDVITLRHLLNHTSGLRSQFELLILAGWRADDVMSHRDQMVIIQRQRELNFPPGERHLYSNSGYTLLAEVVERVTGKNLKTWSQQNIFTPLDMTNTHFHDDHQHIVAGRVYSYMQDDGGEYINSVLNSAYVGSSGLFSTVGDLAKWVRSFQLQKLGSSSLYEHMVAKAVLNDGSEIPYGFGLSIGEFIGMATVGHDGADAGFRADTLYIPSMNFGAIVLSNLSSIDSTALNRQIAGIYLQDQIQDTDEPEKNPDSVTLDEAYLQSLTGKYIFDSGSIMDVVFDGTDLVRKIEGTDDVPLIAKSQTDFVYKTRPVDMSYVLDSEGNVEKIVYPGLSMQARPYIPWYPSPEAIDRIAGSYFSEELGTTYTITQEENGLYLLHRRHGRLSLAPLRENEFVAEIPVWDQPMTVTLKLVPDHEGNDVDVLMSTDRVLNVAFKRVNESPD